MLATFTTSRGRKVQIGRTPKGGIEFHGRTYRGGQFCPIAALPLAGGAPAFATRREAADAIAEALEAEGYDARPWYAGEVARVYVKRHEHLGRKGRKTSDHGFIEIRDRIDFGHLTRMAGTIEGYCDGIAFAAPAPATRAAAPMAEPEDALDPLEAEARRGMGVEAERFG